jgi:hypothetical protein
MTINSLALSAPPFASLSLTRRRALSLLGLGALSSVATFSEADAAQYTVVYLGAKDCAACQRFEAYDKAAFEHKIASRGMSFREFKVESLRYIKDAEYWPSDLMWLHRQLRSEAGAPWFFVTRAQQLITETQYFRALV